MNKKKIFIPTYNNVKNLKKKSKQSTKISYKK